MRNLMTIRHFVVSLLLLVAAVSVHAAQQSPPDWKTGFLTTARKQLAGAVAHPTYAAKLAAARNDGLPTNLAEIFPKPSAGPNAAGMFVKMESMKPDDLEYAAVSAISTKDQLSESDWDAMRRFLKRDARLVSLAESAARMTNCVFTRTDTGQDPAAITFPEYTQIRRAAQIIEIKSVLMAHDGHAVDAVREQTLGFQTGRDAHRDVLLIGWLVGLTNDAITLKGMQRILILSHGGPAAEAVETSVARNWEPTPLTEPLKQEMANWSSEIAHIKTHGPGSMTALGVTVSNHPLPLTGKLWNAFIDANGSHYIDLMRRSIDASRRPYPQSKTEFDAISKDLLASGSSIQYWLVDVIYLDPSKGATTGALIQSTADITRCAAAVLVWRGQHPDYPARLEQAMPQVPTDPFDGRPMKYRRVGRGFVIYSVGESGHDNGGAPSDGNGALSVFRYP
ncbi:MAG: hypothetical protein ACLQVD_12585 [Capsulimonadaceae bacterium]